MPDAALPGKLVKKSGFDCGRLCERLKKRLDRLQISRVETFGEAAVDRLEERPRVSGTALFAQQPDEAGGGRQFPGQGAPQARPVERLSVNWRAK
jgi:hypothetical protein